jgi:hypothetical protein
MEALLACGFTQVRSWHLTPAGDLVFETAVPKEAGVYAFVRDGVVLYVGYLHPGQASQILYHAGVHPTDQPADQRAN